MSDESSSRSVVVRNRQGLHMRPADLLVKAAMKFQSRVELEKDGQVVDGRSILGILTLGAQSGATLEIRAFGQDAQQAVEALAELFEKSFFENEQEMEGAT